MDLKNKFVSVIGLGKTGIAVANFLSLQGAEVSIMDNKSQEQLSGFAKKLLPAIKVIYQNCTPLPNSEMVVVSPGVSQDAIFLQDSREKGTEIISEIELASRFNSSPLIGVTGTNGKSTCTSLIGEILKEGGKNIQVGVAHRVIPDIIYNRYKEFLLYLLQNITNESSYKSRF